MTKAMLLACTFALLVGAAPGFARDMPSAAKQPSAAAQTLVGAAIYSSDGQKIGTVISVDVGEDGTIKSVKGEIEGFLGLGSSSLRISADQFKQSGDGIVLSKTADQMRGVPDESYKPWQ